MYVVGREQDVRNLIYITPDGRKFLIELKCAFAHKSLLQLCSGDVVVVIVQRGIQNGRTTNGGSQNAIIQSACARYKFNATHLHRHFIAYAFICPRIIHASQKYVCAPRSIFEPSRIVCALQPPEYDLQIIS